MPADRPGCVTLYALVLWLAAAAHLVVACYVAFSAFTIFQADPAVAGGIMAVGLGLAFLSFAAGLGLWSMSRYGWGLVFLWQLAAFAGGVLLIYLFATEMVLQDPIILSATGVIAGYLVVNGAILYWLLKNRDLFGPAAEDDGEIVLSGRQRVAILLLGGLAVVLLLLGFLLLTPTIFGPEAGRTLDGLLDQVRRLLPPDPLD
jgi:hypothetical protein